MYNSAQKSEFIKYHHPSKTYIDNMVKNVVVNIKMAFVRKIINHEKNNKIIIINQLSCYILAKMNSIFHYIHHSFQ